MKSEQKKQLFDRRDFLKIAGISAGAGILGIQQGYSNYQQPPSKPVIQGFEDTGSKPDVEKIWTPASNRKVKVGLIGYGYCQFAAAFGFQNHPNVEVVAVSDLIPERCAELANVTNCKKTYSSLEELIKDDEIEAVFIATDAPSHAQHCIDALNHGKHVACAVPAVFGSLDDAHRLYETV